MRAALVSPYSWSYPGGVTRHIYGYLEDFLFPPERARSPVKALSGGERNRLLLARLLTQPANVLILDEPTNDLDIETLELLEAQLVDFPGTLLIVSHDRTFLDHVVTSTLVFEGEARDVMNQPRFTARGAVDSVNAAVLLGAADWETQVGARFEAQGTTADGRLDVELLPSRVRAAQLGPGTIHVAIAAGAVTARVAIPGGRMATALIAPSSSYASCSGRPRTPVPLRGPSPPRAP